METIDSYRDLRVYQNAMKAAMEIYELSKDFPSVERFSLTDQIRRSSRSVCANIAEAWRKRRYEGSFISKLNDSEAEAAETRVWLEFANRSEFFSSSEYEEIDRMFEHILRQLSTMIKEPKKWIPGK